MERHGLRVIRHELSRREFLRVAAGAGAGAVLLGACGSDDGNTTSTPADVADPPPETTTIRLARDTLFPSMAPLYLAEQFLATEGFTNVQYIDVTPDYGGLRQLAAGEIDIGLPFAAPLMVAVDRRDQLVLLAGVHNSFFQLLGNDRVQSLRDLKGKRIHVLKREATDATYAFMAALLAYVGIDAEHEVEFVELGLGEASVQLEAGTIDAWTVVRPYSTGYQNANLGHIVLDSFVNPPWSQYFGGMATGNRDFVRQYPAATKRALRAILKAADVCAREPERAARYLVDRGFSPLNYDLALDGVIATSYAAWREFNPEDTVRFYALRLNDAGLVRRTPDELIARATDWRYVDEIKRELAVT